MRQREQQIKQNRLKDRRRVLRKKRNKKIKYNNKNMIRKKG